MHTTTEVARRNVFVVRDMPHFAPYLQFLVNVIQIHFEHVTLGGYDYHISGAINREDLEILYKYLHQLEPGAAVEIKENDARVLYASFVIVSRLMLCDYGEEICKRLIQNLPSAHPWSNYEVFRNTILRHNAQMLMDMDNNMTLSISGLGTIKQQLELIDL